MGGEREEEDKEVAGASGKAWEFVRFRPDHQEDTITLPLFFRDGPLIWDDPCHAC